EEEDKQKQKQEQEQEQEQKQKQEQNRSALALDSGNSNDVGHATNGMSNGVDAAPPNPRETDEVIDYGVARDYFETPKEIKPNCARSLPSFITYHVAILNLPTIYSGTALTLSASVRMVSSIGFKQGVMTPCYFT